MSNTVFEEHIKQTVEPSKSLCRCCLSTDRPMKDVVYFQSYFIDLAALDVSQADGLPQCICYECSALLRKATRFKQKILRAHAMLYEYRMRCAPFPIDAQDPELCKYASPHLDVSETLVVDSKRGKTGSCKVLQHNKRVSKIHLEEVELQIKKDKETERTDHGDCSTHREHGNYSTHSSHGDRSTQSDNGDHEDNVKQEMDFDDYDDNITLEKFKSESKVSIDNVSMGSLCPDDLDQMLDQKLKEFLDDKTDGATSSTKKVKKDERVKKKGVKHKTKDPYTSRQSSIRKAIELDPTKIRVITLNPEEQLRQRQEESKTGLKSPFQCQLCFKGFNFEAKLQNHMNKHSPSRGTFECTLCQMYLPTSYSLSVHSLIHTRRYECVGCGVRMIDRTSIWLHYRTQHEGLVTRYTCDMCGKVSHNYKTHRGHLRNHHCGQRPRCPHAACGRTFVNEDSLNEHLQIHQGIKNYECSQCKKRFRTRTQIKQHMLKHSDVKQYYCVECDVRFKSEHNLRQHLKKSLKHKDKNSFKHPCPRCEKRFESLPSLSHHVAVAHEGVRAHRCPTCNASLATRASLTKHIARVHQGRRPPHSHVCHTCGKAFAGKSVLVNHVRTHTGEKPFECSTCGRKFTQRTAMLTHVKLVHLKVRRSAKIKPDMPLGEREQPKLDVPLYPKEETPIFDGYFYIQDGPHGP